MFLLPMLALATMLMVSFFVLHQTTKIAVAIPLSEESCSITTPETNRTALLSNDSYSIVDINASNISTVPYINQNILQHEKHSSVFDLVSKQNVTRQQVLDELNLEEPNYDEAAAKLGPEAIPILRTLVQDENNILLATKATYIVSLIGSNNEAYIEQSISILQDAAQSDYPEVRVAAAAGASNFNKVDAKDILDLFRRENDTGVCQEAEKSSQKLSLQKLECRTSNEH
jgi:hypothetical protein